MIRPHTQPILIANEPRSYREALASVLRLVRPSLEIRETDPDGLDQALLGRSLAVVIASRPNVALEQRAATWILLYPEGARLAVVCDAGTIPMRDLDLTGLLAIIDRAVGRVRV